MLHYLRHRSSLIAGLSGGLLALIFLVLVLHLSGELQREVRVKLVDRAAAILQPIAQRQFEQRKAEAPELPVNMLLVSGLLSRAAQEGLLAMAIFDVDGQTLEAVPSNSHFVDLPADDYLRAGTGMSLCRFHEDFALEQIGGDGKGRAPVLEVIVPIRDAGASSSAVVGFVQYHLDARRLEQDLGLIADQIRQQSQVTLLIGLVSVTVVTLAGLFALQKAHRQLEERNARLVQTQVELTLTAKAAAMGQITSHLMHALKGAVAGLRASTQPGGAPDLAGVIEYTARVEAMIHDTMDILGDLGRHTSYQLPAGELARGIRERNGGAAQDRGVTLEVHVSGSWEIDNHRGSLLCLIANNLIQNALEASAPGQRVVVQLSRTDDDVVRLSVSDQGSGIPEKQCARLFQPGLSTRPGGSGLGLALSRLLARQMNGELSLVSSCAKGTVFELEIPQAGCLTQAESVREA